MSSLEKRLIGSVVFVVIAFYLLPAGLRPLWVPDEMRYAEVSREMLASGDWIVPKLLNLRYFEKPVGGYWLNNIGQLLFGQTRFAVRFASILCSLLSTAAVGCMALQLWKSRQWALTAMLLYASSLIVCGVGCYSVLDPQLTWWLTAAMGLGYLVLEGPLSAKQRALYSGLLGVSLGCAFLTKGFLAWAIPTVALFPYVVLQRRFLRILQNSGWILLGLLVVALPWVLLVAQREPDYWHYFFWVEHVQRFMGENAQHKAPYWYFLPCLLAGVLPWVALLPGAVKSGAVYLVSKNKPFGYLWLWFVMPFLLFSLSKGKLLTYILPCFAPLTLLMTDVLYRADPARMRWLSGWVGITNMLFGMVGLYLIGASSWFQTAVLEMVPDQRQPVHYFLRLTIFGTWMLCGVVIFLRRQSGSWWMAPFSLLACVLLLCTALPSEVTTHKAPETFLKAHYERLRSSHYLFADAEEIAVSLGWVMQRKDIRFVGSMGELEYGLQYSDASDRRLTPSAFSQFLADHRSTSQIALIVKKRTVTEAINIGYPKPDELHVTDRLALLIYHKQAVFDGN